MKLLRYLILTLALGAGCMSASADPAEYRDVDNRAVAQLQAAPVIKVVGQTVEISLPGDEARQLVVYAITGQVVKTLVVQPGLTTIDLKAGYYIIKCDRLSQRVVIR